MKNGKRPSRRPSVDDLIGFADAPAPVAKRERNTARVPRAPSQQKAPKGDVLRVRTRDYSETLPSMGRDQMLFYMEESYNTGTSGANISPGPGRGVRAGPDRGRVPPRLSVERPELQPQIQGTTTGRKSLVVPREEQAGRRNLEVTMLNTESLKVGQKPSRLSSYEDKQQTNAQYKRRNSFFGDGSTAVQDFASRKLPQGPPLLNVEKIDVQGLLHLDATTRNPNILKTSLVSPGGFSLGGGLDAIRSAGSRPLGEQNKPTAAAAITSGADVDKEDTTGEQKVKSVRGASVDRIAFGKLESMKTQVSERFAALNAAPRKLQVEDLRTKVGLPTNFMPDSTPQIGLVGRADTFASGDERLFAMQAAMSGHRQLAAPSILELGDIDTPRLSPIRRPPLRVNELQRSAGVDVFSTPIHHKREQPGVSPDDSNASGPAEVGRSGRRNRPSKEPDSTQALKSTLLRVRTSAEEMEDVEETEEARRAREEKTAAAVAKALSPATRSGITKARVVGGVLVVEGEENRARHASPWHRRYRTSADVDNSKVDDIASSVGGAPSSVISGGTAGKMNGGPKIGIGSSSSRFLPTKRTIVQFAPNHVGGGGGASSVETSSVAVVMQQQMISFNQEDAEMTGPGGAPMSGRLSLGGAGGVPAGSVQQLNGISGKLGGLNVATMGGPNNGPFGQQSTDEAGLVVPPSSSTLGIARHVPNYATGALFSGNAGVQFIQSRGAYENPRFDDPLSRTVTSVGTVIMNGNESKSVSKSNLDANRRQQAGTAGMLSQQSSVGALPQPGGLPLPSLLTNEPPQLPRMMLELSDAGSPRRLTEKAEKLSQQGLLALQGEQRQLNDLAVIEDPTVASDFAPGPRTNNAVPRSRGRNVLTASQGPLSTSPASSIASTPRRPLPADIRLPPPARSWSPSEDNMVARGAAVLGQMTMRRMQREQAGGGSTPRVEAGAGAGKNTTTPAPLKSQEQLEAALRTVQDQVQQVASVVSELAHHIARPHLSAAKLYEQDPSLERPVALSRRASNGEVLEMRTPRDIGEGEAVAPVSEETGEDKSPSRGVALINNLADAIEDATGSPGVSVAAVESVLDEDARAAALAQASEALEAQKQLASKLLEQISSSAEGPPEQQAAPGLGENAPVLEGAASGASAASVAAEKSRAEPLEAGTEDDPIWRPTVTEDVEGEGTVTEGKAVEESALPVAEVGEEPGPAVEVPGADDPEAKDNEAIPTVEDPEVVATPADGDGAADDADEKAEAKAPAKKAAKKAASAKSTGDAAAKASKSKAAAGKSPAKSGKAASPDKKAASAGAEKKAAASSEKAAASSPGADKKAAGAKAAGAKAAAKKEVPVKAEASSTKADSGKASPSKAKAKTGKAAAGAKEEAATPKQAATAKPKSGILKTGSTAKESTEVEKAKEVVVVAGAAAAAESQPGAEAAELAATTATTAPTAPEPKAEKAAAVAKKSTEDSAKAGSKAKATTAKADAKPKAKVAAKKAAGGKAPAAKALFYSDREVDTRLDVAPLHYYSTVSLRGRTAALMSAKKQEPAPSSAVSKAPMTMIAPEKLLASLNLSGPSAFPLSSSITTAASSQPLAGTSRSAFGSSSVARPSLQVRSPPTAAEPFYPKRVNVVLEMTAPTQAQDVSNSNEASCSKSMMNLQLSDSDSCTMLNTDCELVVEDRIREPETLPRMELFSKTTSSVSVGEKEEVEEGSRTAPTTTEDEETTTTTTTSAADWDVGHVIVVDHQEETTTTTSAQEDLQELSHKDDYLELTASSLDAHSCGSEGLVTLEPVTSSSGSEDEPVSARSQVQTRKWETQPCAIAEPASPLKALQDNLLRNRTKSEEEIVLTSSGSSSEVENVGASAFEGGQARTSGEGYRENVADGNNGAKGGSSSTSASLEDEDPVCTNDAASSSSGIITFSSLEQGLGSIGSLSEEDVRTVGTLSDIDAVICSTSGSVVQENYPNKTGTGTTSGNKSREKPTWARGGGGNHSAEAESGVKNSTPRKSVKRVKTASRVKAARGGKRMGETPK
ncbi:unnamed protein product [Amoebophrya sp. A25]|nr:unnamed protein product [Amoebophrya sp. A25]|eukprot:GSA25T00002839001.1